MLAGSTPMWLASGLVSRHKFTVWSGQPGGNTNALMLVEPVYMNQLQPTTTQQRTLSSPGLPITPASSEPASLNIYCIYVSLSEEGKNIILISTVPYAEIIISMLSVKNKYLRNADNYQISALSTKIEKYI